MDWKDRVKELRRVPASELKANPKNWREHPADQRKALGGVLEEIGIAGALIARETDDGLELIDGHLRTEMDDSTEWPVLVLDVNEAEADILLATIDPIGALASRNDAALTDLIASIETDNAALGEMLDAMEKDIPTQIVEGETDADAVPEGDQVEKRCEPGDLWTMGLHRLICGDSLEPGVVDRLMGSDAATMAFTDPPYNVDYNKQETPRDQDGRPLWGDRKSLIANDSMSQEDWHTFTSKIADTMAANVCGCVYVCHAPGPDGRTMATALDKAMHWGASIVWAKDRMVFGRASYQRRHEVIWFGWPEGVSRTFTDDRTITDVWEFNKPQRSEMHPTMKPVELVVQAVTHASHRGDLVFDPFMGSGTTLIAAEQTGRSCVGVELDPHYCDVILQRWEDFSGLKAERA